MFGLNDDYGLPDDLRLDAVRSSEKFGVKIAADLHHVSVASIYRWRALAYRAQPN